MNREEALQQAAFLKVKYNLSAFEIGHAAAVIRIPLGNPAVAELDTSGEQFASLSRCKNGCAGCNNAAEAD